MNPKEMCEMYALKVKRLQADVGRFQRWIVKWKAMYMNLATEIHKALEGSESQERAQPEYEIKQIVRRFERINIEIDRLRAGAEVWETEARRQGKRVKLLLAEVKRLRRINETQERRRTMDEKIWGKQSDDFEAEIKLLRAKL